MTRDLPGIGTIRARRLRYSGIEAVDQGSRMARPDQDKAPGGKRLRALVWGGAAFLLLLPLIAMQFTTEVDWDQADFVVFGAMLLFVCGGYELATRVSGNRAYRLGAGIALLGAFLLTWMNLAVGIIGNEENPANLVFFAVPATGLLGALLARFEARGMARALVVTAVVQALIAVVALVSGWGQVFVLTGFFVLLWLSSAQFFRKASLGNSVTD